MNTLLQYHRHTPETSDGFYHADCPQLFAEHDTIGSLTDCPFPLVTDSFRVVLFGTSKSFPEDKRRAPLTESEREYLLPLYIAARVKGDEKKRNEQRAEVEAEYKRDCARAEAEYQGKLWLLARSMTLENVIYYNHTERFCFGWRTAYGPKAAGALSDALTGFPYAFDITTEGQK